MLPGSQNPVLDAGRLDPSELAVMQLDRRFATIRLSACVMQRCRRADRRQVVHNTVQHLQPGGDVVAEFDLGVPDGVAVITEYEQLAFDCELERVATWSSWEGDRYVDGDRIVTVHRRSDRFNVHDLVFESRSVIGRLSPAELAVALRSDTPPLVIDTRSHVDRQRFGVIAGSLHLPRTVVEWHLDPANGFREAGGHSLDDPLVVVCNGGYSSSLSAANLTRLGYTSVADLVGGVAAWKRAGFEVVAPDHSHLDF